MEPNPLAIVALCMGGATCLIFVLWLNHRLRVPKKKETATQVAQPSMIARLLYFVMSYVFGGAGPIETIETEQRSYAVEPSREPSGTQAAEPAPDLLEQLASLDDDALLDLLALLPGDVDGYRYAESRIAKFIPGRVEDRLTQVRDIRGTQKPPPPDRTLRVRDGKEERVISMVAR